MTDTIAPDEHPHRAMGRDEVLTILRTHKAELERRFDVATLALFGSTSRDEDRPDSDVDLLVTFHGPATFDGFFGAERYLAEILGRKVDLISDRTLHRIARPTAERDKVYV